MSRAVKIRPAEQADVPAIHRLLDVYARQQIVLPRSVDDILHYLGNFLVALDAEERVIGCVAMRDFGNGLREVRSLAVEPEMKRRGVGRMLVEGCIGKLRNIKEPFRLFALTLQPEFFSRLGFLRVNRDLFPEKIWSDCANCPKKECCDEIAVLYTDEME